MASSTPPPHCACGQPAHFRCPECAPTKMVCAACLVSMHSSPRLHHAEKWDGEVGFKRIRLFDVGHNLHLGHDGAVCPTRRRGELAAGRKTVLVDVNGIHLARIYFCRCGIITTGEDIQLLQARLFPATLQRPSTVFTFEVLDNFYAHHLASKMTAGGYYRGLRKLTGNTFPQGTPDRVREFLHVAREWRDLEMCDIPEDTSVQ
ncbi:hypothetical protein C8R46DRAFT_536689 [Mycena filopes]|nr:hypothetical protein C8R46DRAFT_536689 [Mycena filopes]